jgi:hypothetical protein
MGIGESYPKRGGNKLETEKVGIKENNCTYISTTINLNFGFFSLDLRHFVLFAWKPYQ